MKARHDDWWERKRSRVHGLKIKKGKWVHACGIPAKRFVSKVARPKNDEAHDLTKDKILKQIELMDKVTCVKCKELMAHGHPVTKDRPKAKRQLGLDEIVAVLESYGYNVDPPAPTTPEFMFPSDKYPVAGALFKEFLTFMSGK